MSFPAQSQKSDRAAKDPWVYWRYEADIRPPGVLADTPHPYTQRSRVLMFHSYVSYVALDSPHEKMGSRLLCVPAMLPTTRLFCQQDQPEPASS